MASIPLAARTVDDTLLAAGVATNGGMLGLKVPARSVERLAMPSSRAAAARARAERAILSLATPETMVSECRLSKVSLRPARAGAAPVIACARLGSPPSEIRGVAAIVLRRARRYGCREIEDRTRGDPGETDDMAEHYFARAARIRTAY